MLTDKEKEAISLIIGMFKNMKNGELFNCLSSDIQEALISAKEKCDKG